MCYFVEILCLQSSARYTWHTWQLPRTSREIIFFDENYVSAWHTVLSVGDALLALLENEAQLLSLASSQLVRQMFSSIATFSSLPAVYIRREEARHHLRLHCPQMIGVKESSESGSVRWSTVKGRVFILLHVLHTSWSSETQYQLDANLRCKNSLSIECDDTDKGE